MACFGQLHFLDKSLRNAYSTSPSKSQEYLMINFIQNVSCCLARILRSETMLLCNLLQEKGTNSEKGIGTKKFLNFWGLWQDTICLMRYSCQALFPPSTRATLKSFGDVFAQSCCQCRCKWDGTLGTASADFQVFGHTRKYEYLKGKGFAVTNEKNVDLKRKLFGKFQHNTVLKSFSKRTLHFIRWSQTIWWNLLSRRQR